MPRPAFAFAALLAVAPPLVACGSAADGAPSSSGWGTLSGPLAFPVSAAVAQPFSDLTDGGSDLEAVTIDLFQLSGSVPTGCSQTAAGSGPQTVVTEELTITVATNTLFQGGPVVKPGVYPVVGPLSAVDGGASTNAAGVVLLSVSDGGTNFSYASGGTVTLTSTGGDYVGTFAIEFPGNDGGASSLTGEFNTPLCR